LNIGFPIVLQHGLSLTLLSNGIRVLIRVFGWLNMGFQVLKKNPEKNKISSLYPNRPLGLSASIRRLLHLCPANTRRNMSSSQSHLIISSAFLQSSMVVHYLTTPFYPRVIFPPRCMPPHPLMIMFYIFIYCLLNFSRNSLFSLYFFFWLVFLC